MEGIKPSVHNAFNGHATFTELQCNSKITRPSLVGEKIIFEYRLCIHNFFYNNMTMEKAVRLW